jgi:hypothetical protein
VVDNKSLFAAVHHKLYIATVTLDQVVKESPMFPAKTLARIYGLPSQKPSQSIGYDEVFKGEASAPEVVVMDGDLLPGLRPVEYDVDAYFKEVFVGQVF